MSCAKQAGLILFYFHKFFNTKKYILESGSIPHPHKGITEHYYTSLSIDLLIKRNINKHTKYKA